MKKIVLCVFLTGFAVIYSVNAKSPAQQKTPISSAIKAECNEYAYAHLKALQWQQNGIGLSNASHAPENHNSLMQDALARVYTIRTTLPATLLEATMFRRCIVFKNKSY